MANTFLTRAASGSVTSDKTFTISTWLKKSANGVQQRWFNHENESSHVQKLDLHFIATDLFRMGWWDGSNEYNLDTKRAFRDTNAWYHFVFRLDTTQATASNRVRLYVNGELQELTAIGGGSPTPQYPAQNGTMNLGQRKLVYGRYQAASPNHYWNGSMSHSHYCDGQSYAPTVFGETDSTTGEWKIKTNVTATYGNNGHFILKDGNSVTDQSGNSNNFTVGGGTLTKTEDNPSNIFCTGNPLARYNGNVNYSNGANFITGGGNNWTMGSATMGASTGKYYYELKILSAGTGSGYFKMGFQSADQSYANAGHSAQSELDASYAFYCQNGNLEVRTDGAVISGYDISTLGVSFSMNDIMCLAIDMDNKKAYFRKNADAWIKSADPVNGTNGLDVSSEYPAGKGMVPNFAIYYPGTAALNFGNGYFGTTAVSSAGTNASNNGIFEFDVPTGYTALSTKGLNL
tara:strand:+ start:117 stop:1496 length:1380 start_codon:yes stop_codon:yes gene_type:complete